MDAGYIVTRDMLRQRLLEPAPARIQLLTGPRQVGKTTILLALASAYGDRALYLAADASEAILAGWWATQWQRALRMARTGPALLLVDEVQTLPQWSSFIKAAIDEVYRERLPLHLVLSGSASLPITGGVRESLAGRFERLTLRHWTARDLVQEFGMPADEAAETYVRLGAFPGALAFRRDDGRRRAYVHDAIIDPAVGRDLLLIETVRKPALLRQVFAICTGHPGEVLALKKMAGNLHEPGALETIAHYLTILGEAYLVAALPKFSTAEVRRRASPPKLVPLSNAFLALAPDEQPPTPVTAPRRWGRWLENACLARAVNAGYEVTYWREEPLEVDMIITGPAGRWAVEIKGGEFTTHDLAGLYEFVRRNPTYRPLVIGEEAYRDTALKAGVDFLRWQDFVLDGVSDAENRPR